MNNPNLNEGSTMISSSKVRRVTGILGVTVSFILAAEPSAACLWDTNTVRDELELEDTQLFHLITGQFPQHSLTFYQAQATSSRVALEANSADLRARDDLGVAYAKMGQFKEALAVFQSLDALKPKRYETLSNLGVLHKKMGQFSKAHQYIKRALEIRPGGHMGLGDWYLRMIRFRMENAEESSQGRANFLGYSYGEQEWIWRLEDEEEHVFLSKLKGMIRNDRHFPDTYVVLGDVLSQRLRKKNMALWCYARSLELDHPHPKVVEERVRELHEHWKAALKNTYTVGKYVENFDDMLIGVRTDLRARENWLGRFKDVERRLIEYKQNHSFTTVADHLQREEKVLIAPPMDYGIKRSSSLIDDTTRLHRIALFFIVLLSLLFALKAQQSWKKSPR